MKTVYIVRHAKSDWGDPNVPDIERSLNQRGLEAAPMMGKRLKGYHIKPQLMLCSPAKRARTTAELLLPELGLTADEITTCDELYNAGLLELIKLIHKTDNHYESLMLFGHNPGFTQLANHLGDQHIGNMPTCSVYAIEFQVDDWHAVYKGVGTCTLFDYPKKEH